MKNVLLALCTIFCLLSSIVSVSLYKKIDRVHTRLDSMTIFIDSFQLKTESNFDSLWSIHPWQNPKAIKKSKRLSSNYCKESTFLGFILWRVKSTEIHEDLEKALTGYSGPKVKITSLKRHWGTKSKHECGKAVDLELCPNLVNWLCTSDGIAWLESHNLKFYIEDRPNSKSLEKYKADEVYSKYVFENKRATGPHIHIEIV